MLDCLTFKKPNANCRNASKSLSVSGKGGRPPKPGAGGFFFSLQKLLHRIIADLVGNLDLHTLGSSSIKR
jgi:hypothetical protein